MIQSTTGLIHTVAAVIALLAGAVIFFRPKANRLHRWTGYVYSASMVVLLVTAFGIYRLTKSFNVLHVFAIVACPPLILGFWAAFRRRNGWLERHYYWMCYSYIGLCAALVAEVATRVVMPFAVQHWQLRSFGLFWALVAVSSCAVVYAGSRLVERNRALVETLKNRA